MGAVEWMPAWKIFRVQAAAEAFFQAADAQATTERRHACCLPYRPVHDIDFATLIYLLRDAWLLSRKLCNRRRCFEGALHRDPVMAAGSRVDAAVNTAPTFRHHALEVYLIAH
jgi:hypothetical protein